MEVDRAVFFSVTLRMWQVLVGPISMVLIAQCLSREAQGYYYTFASLLSLQAFCEMGLHGVVSNLASHEWAQLNLTVDGRVSGEASALARLSGIYRFMVNWYRGVAALFVGVVGAVGLILFSRSTTEIEWLAPWLAFVGLNGLVLWTWAMTTLLEGCNQLLHFHLLR